MRLLPETTPAPQACESTRADHAAVADLAFARRVEDWLAGLSCSQSEREMRRQLFRQAAATGLPDPRKEAWRYADLKGLRLAAFFPSLALAEALAEADEDEASPWPKLRFRDGCCCDRNRGEDDALGAWSLDRGCPPDLLAQDVLESDESIWRLARAFATHGAQVNLARGQHHQLELISTTHAGAAHGLHHLKLAQDTDLTLLVRFQGGATAVSERIRLTLEDGARARILLLQEAATATHHFLRVDADIGARAELVLVQAVVGAGYARAEHHWRFAGAAGRGALALLGLPHAGGKADVLTRFRHADQNTQSRQSVRMLAARQDRAAYQGLVHVAEGADGTDSRQDAKGLLLTPGGEIDLKPELEIFADEVACAHGATVGQLDPLALFYLTARGIPETQARRMLIAAFADAVIRLWPGEDAFLQAMEETVAPALAALSAADEGEAA